MADELDDADADGIANEIPTALVDYLEFYLLNYFSPGLYRETRTAVRGLEMFKAIGCASCHVQDLTIRHDRRVADVETVYDPRHGIFNRLFATVNARFEEVDDASGYASRGGRSSCTTSSPTSSVTTSVRDSTNGTTTAPCRHSS